MQHQLNGILAMVDQMGAVDTDRRRADVASAGRHAAAARGRVTEADQRELFQSIAPAVEDGLYLVPKVIE